MYGQSVIHVILMTKPLNGILKLVHLVCFEIIIYVQYFWLGTESKNLLETLLKWSYLRDCDLIIEAMMYSTLWQLICGYHINTLEITIVLCKC